MNIIPRQLTDHKLNGLNEALVINVLDQPGSGGANHEYEIRLVVPALTSDTPGEDRVLAYIRFQNGPIKEAGFNGLTNEALLAIIIDRMQGFQSGPYKSRENAIALTHLEDAMHWLQHRTRARLARGVEGTHQV